MKKQRRDFFKKTLAVTFGLALCDSVSGLTLNGNLLKDEKSKIANKKLIIKEIAHDGEIDIETANKLLDINTDFQLIDILNWPSYSYKPDVKFKIAYCQDQILLKYHVSEGNVLAQVARINGDVCKDSCVEFFISTRKDDSFYNFEFNCIGIPHVEYGKVGKRALLDPEIIKKIKTKSTLGNQPFDEKKGGHQWELMIIIPKACFAFDKDLVFKGLNAKANFYKCGDNTSSPHYLTWNPVNTKHPDYHQPAFFGEILFK